MGCPFYVDFTRMCLEKLPDVVKFSTFEFCESEHFPDCPLFLLSNSDFQCENANRCGNQLLEETPGLIQHFMKGSEIAKLMLEFQVKYCISPEKSKTCARYQEFSKGKKPPVSLTPDGRTMNLVDVIFKRKRILKPIE